MKFQLALDEKSLTRDDLPKSQQVKIKEIEKLKTQIEQIESEGVEDSFQDEFDKIKLQFDQADEEVVVFIRNFDVEKSRKQRAHLADMRSRIKKPAAEVKTEEPKAEPAPEPVKVEEPKVEAPIVPMPQPSQQEVSERLEALKREAQVYPEQFSVEPDEEEFEEVEAEEEFEKVGKSKPRKLNVPLVIMGVGALLLTWGAVNFFKNKE
jgi:hypothetical protein